MGQSKDERDTPEEDTRRSAARQIDDEMREESAAHDEEFEEAIKQWGDSHEDEADGAEPSG